MTTKGLFIALEGGEGTGKTTQAKLLSNVLYFDGYDVRLVREPGGTTAGELVRSILLERNVSLHALTEVYLFAAARAELVQTEIAPALKAGEVVIADRFLASSLAYQGTARNLGFSIVLDVNHHGITPCYPDLTIVYDLEPKIALQRACRRGDTDRFESEKLEFHRLVRYGYEQVRNMWPSNVVKIDCNNLSKEQVLRRTLTTLEERFPERFSFAASP